MIQALKLNPKNAGALFGRGLAKLARNDMTGSADIEAAKTIMPNIAEKFARYGVSEILAKKPEDAAPVRKAE